jgi:hypothetical protein
VKFNIIKYKEYKMESETKFLSSEGLRHHIAKVKTLVGSKANQSELESLQETVAGLSEVVGDDSDGLVKAVADNTTAIADNAAAIETEKARAEAAEQELSNRINGIGSGMGDVTIDAALDTASTNPIQNQAVATAINGINSTLTGLSTVSRTGSYNDLINKPTIPVVPIVRDDMEATFTLVDASSNPVITIAAPDGGIVINDQNIATAAAIDEHNSSISAHSAIRTAITNIQNNLASINTWKGDKSLSEQIEAVLATSLDDYATEQYVTESIATVKTELEAEIDKRPRMYTVTVSLEDNATVVEEAGTAKSVPVAVTDGEIDLQGLFSTDLFTESLTPDALLWLVQNQRVTGLGGYFTYGDATVIISKIAAVSDGETRKLVLIGSKYTSGAVQARVVYKVTLDVLDISLKNSYDIMASPIISLTSEAGETLKVDFGESADRTATVLDFKDDIYILVGENTTIDLDADEIDLHGHNLVIMGAGSDTSAVEALIIDKSDQEGGRIQVSGLTIGESNLEEEEMN